MGPASVIASVTAVSPQVSLRARRRNLPQSSHITRGIRYARNDTGQDIGHGIGNDTGSGQISRAASGRLDRIATPQAQARRSAPRRIPKRTPGRRACTTIERAPARDVGIAYSSITSPGNVMRAIKIGGILGHQELSPCGVASIPRRLAPGRGNGNSTIRPVGIDAADRIGGWSRRTSNTRPAPARSRVARCSALGVGNSRIEPSIATRATALPSASLIQTKPPAGGGRQRPAAARDAGGEFGDLATRRDASRPDPHRPRRTRHCHPGRRQCRSVRLRGVGNENSVMTPAGVMRPIRWPCGLR